MGGTVKETVETVGDNSEKKAMAVTMHQHLVRLLDCTLCLRYCIKINKEKIAQQHCMDSVIHGSGPILFTV